MSLSKHPRRIRLLISLSLTLAVVWVAATNGTTVADRWGTAALTPRLYLPLVLNQLYRTVYTSHNLVSHAIYAECNPGGVSACPCSASDARLGTYDDYGEVTSNPRRIGTYVNAIGYQKFTETLPTGEAIHLGVYSYSGQFSLPLLPAPNVLQTENPQAVHLMIQLWDGRNALFQSDQTTREGTIFWEINPWLTDTGKIKVYVNPLTLTDTGITLPPDINWHTFELVVDLTAQKYVSLTIDGQTKDLSNLDLARVYQPTWGSDVSLAITTESLASWPNANGSSCPYVFAWTTRFRDLAFGTTP